MSKNLKHKAKQVKKDFPQFRCKKCGKLIYSLTGFKHSDYSYFEPTSSFKYCISCLKDLGSNKF